MENRFTYGCILRGINSDVQRPLRGGLHVVDDWRFVAGYLSFRQKTDGEILENFSRGHFGDPFDVLLIVHLILYVFGSC